MRRILLERLDDGALPIYDNPTPGESVVGAHWAEGYEGWEPLYTRAQRFVIGLGVDTKLNTFIEELPKRLAAWDDGGHDYTIIFALRCVSSWRVDLDKYASLFVMGGIGLVMGDTLGKPLEGADPIQLIRQLCMAAFAQSKGLPQGVLHPLVQEGLVRHQTASTDIVDDYKQKQEAAQAKALELLSEHLDPMQIEELANHGQFHVWGLDGQRYRICRKHSHNVFRIVDGQAVTEYCIGVSTGVPTPDTMLMQKLLLESDPDLFLKTANVWDLRDGKRRFLGNGASGLVDLNGRPMQAAV